MMRRSPLKRGKPLRANRKPLRRVTRLRARGDTKYRRRERDVPRMLWTKAQPCMVREIPPFLFVSTPEQAEKYKATACVGSVEAAHQGERGMGQKADDSTVVPMCASHHRQRHDHTGVFYVLTKPELRAWRAQAIQRNQTAWENRK